MSDLLLLTGEPQLTQAPQTVKVQSRSSSPVRTGIAAGQLKGQLLLTSKEFHWSLQVTERLQLDHTESQVPKPNKVGVLDAQAAKNPADHKADPR